MQTSLTRKAVSTRVTAHSLTALDALRWTDPPDWAAAGLDEKLLRARRKWISWEDYLRFVELLCGPGASDARVREVGALVVEHGAHTPFRHIARFSGGGQALIEALCTWVIPSEIRVLKGRVEVLRPGLVAVELEIDPDAAPGRIFLLSIEGMLSRAPTILGLPEARVSATIEDRHARYEVSLAPRQDLLARLGRAWRALIDQEGDLDAVRYVRYSTAEALESLHEANRQLETSREQWRTLAENLPGVVVVIDQQGLVQAVHGAERSNTSLAAGRDSFARAVPEDMERLRKDLKRVLEEGATISFEFRSQTKEGELRNWACRAGPLPGEDPFALVVCVDITARRRAEEALRQREEQLLQAWKMEALGRVAEGLAHEINNALMVIRGQVELLDLSHGIDPEVRETARVVIGAVDRATALTGQLRQGRQPGPEAPVVDLGAVLQAAVEELAPIAGPQARFIFEPPQEPLPVRMKPGDIEQAVRNLLLNARQALKPEGSIRLRARRSATGPQALIEVQDDGVGMSAEVAARATEPFFTTRNRAESSGLGLTNVSWAAQRAGGSVEIESEPGLGTLVRIRLPLAKEKPAEAPAPRATPTEKPATREVVLVVEDDPAVRRAVTALVELRGFSALSCEGGEQALQILESMEQLPAAVVTDVTMPGMSGIDLAKRLAGSHPALPVVLISGYPADPEKIDLQQGSPRAWLVKPFRADDLARALRGLLDKPPF